MFSTEAPGESAAQLIFCNAWNALMRTRIRLLASSFLSSRFRRQTVGHCWERLLYAAGAWGRDVTNEIQGGQRTDSSVKAGLCPFAAASPTKPYVHRILARGGAPFWNLTIQLLHSQASNDATDSPGRIDPVLTTVRDSPRGKPLRLNLAPRQTTTLPFRVSDILVVCLSDGSGVQQLPVQPSERWTCKPSDFRLLEQPREPSSRIQPQHGSTSSFSPFNNRCRPRGVRCAPRRGLARWADRQWPSCSPVGWVV
jgi:hypothetical protein